eukprot:TRINITY_DN414_c0_g1_i2.p1 TRINITY_DN414_c0_g1~~TRINITY_DN414_c0_g1_i2.p1  ORF type:complete len:165 (-),score=42.96 TRINITY_DN414_c0_g1_i2:114-608(-)
MPRSGGARRPSSLKSSSSSTKSTTRTTSPPRATPPHQTHAPKTTAVQPAQQNIPHNAPPMMAPQPAGGGMLANIGSMAAGSFIGHVVADKFLGESGEKSAPPPESPMRDMATTQQIQNVCNWPQQSFNDCMAQSKNDFNSCQYSWDMLQQCNKDPQAFRNNFLL